MSEQQQFFSQLEELIALARKQDNVLDEEQVEAKFANLSLNEEQMKLVYAYLLEHKIGIGEALPIEEVLEEEERNYLEMYLEDLKSIKEVTPGEREALFLSAMAGEADACNRLVEVFLKDVVEIAKLYTGQGVLIEDLIGEGNVALTMNVTLLGAAENVKDAEGMLAQSVMNAMEELIGESQDAKAQDEKMTAKVNKVANKAKELSEDLLRAVTVEELAQETGMSQKYIIEAIKLSGNKIEYLDYKEDEA